MLKQIQTLKGIGMAIAFVLIAFGLMIVLDPFLQLSQTPFLLFFGAVTLSALYGGQKAALLATLLSAALANYYFLAPPQSWSLGLPGLLRTLLFLLEGGLISILVGSLQIAQAQVRENFRQLKVTEAEIKALNQSLQRRVDELQTLFNVIPINIAIAEDPDCHLIRVNPAFAKLLQVSLDEHASITPCFDEAKPAFEFRQNGQKLTRDHLPQQYAAKQGVEVRDVEIDLVLQDDTEFNLYGHAVPLFDEAGHPRGSVGVYMDITSRKRREANANFLAKITADFPRLTTPQEIIQALGSQLCAYLNLTTCHFVEIDEASDQANVFECWRIPAAPTIAGIYQLSQFLNTATHRALRAGETIAVSDVQTDARTRAEGFAAIGVRAFVTVPFHRANQWRYLLSVTTDQVRTWHPDKIELIQELANRLFPRLERAEAELAQRRSEERLRAANERFELAAQAVNCLIYDWHVESDYIARTDGLTKIFGYSLAEAEPTGKWWVDRIHPEDFQVIQQEAWAALATADHFASEYRVLNKANEYLYVLDQCVVAARNAAGQPTRIVGSTTNISDRKRAEQQLQESQQFIQQIANSVPGTLYVYDMLEQRNVYVNRQIGELLGYTPEQIRLLNDQLFPQLMHPADFANLDTQVEQLHQAQDGTFVDHEYRMRHANGEWHWLWSRDTVATRTPDGRAHQVVGMVQDITDRKRTEAELKQRELEFRTLVENTPDIITRYDCELRHLYISPNIEQAVGKTAAAIVGKTAAELGLTDPQSQIWYATLQQVFDTGAPCSIEAIYPNPAGELRIYQSHFVPELWEGDTVKTVVSFSRDITEYKHVEASLRQSEERLRLALQAGHLGTWDLDLTTGESLWSEQHFQMFGYEPTPTGKISREQWINRVHPDDRQRISRLWQRAKLEHQLYHAEYRILRANSDQLAWIAALGSFTYDETGTAVRSLGVAFDITDRKQTETHLRESEERLRLALVASNQGLYDLNIQTGKALVSPEYALMLGYDPNDFQETNAKWRDRLHPADQAEVYRVYEDYVAGRVDEYRVEFRQRTYSGDWKWILSVGKIVEWDRAGQPLRMIGTHTDITERKRAEAEREDLLQREQVARVAAERANRVKDEFLAILSHELRSPLNPILGWSKLLQTKKIDPVKTQQALATIERNAKLQTQLIDDLLDIARILRGKLKLNETAVNLAAVIEAALEVVKTAAEAKSIAVQVELTDICPVRGDEARLQQIVWNLLSNAIKFTPSGGRVDIKLEQVDRADAGWANQRAATAPLATFAQITVADTGRGISPDFLPHLFQSFRQEDVSITRQHGGLGLGLSIVKYLVDAHGGTIVAESAGEDQGATFTVRLPLLKDESIHPTTKPLISTGVELAGIKVLAVDDMEDARVLIAILLSQYGAEVKVVNSAVEVLAELETFKPHVLVCDVGMPHIDGYTLLQRIRELPSEQGGDVPAIALTAYAREEDRQRALQYGFQRHIPKPIEPEKLVKAVAELV